MDGQPLAEDVIPINKSGIADGRFGAVRKYATKKRNVDIIKLIDLNSRDGEEFLNWFKEYTNKNKFKQHIEFSIIGDIIKILDSKINNEIIEKMQEFGIKLKENEINTSKEPVEDIDEFDIPNIT